MQQKIKNITIKKNKEIEQIQKKNKRNGFKSK